MFCYLICLSSPEDAFAMTRERPYSSTAATPLRFAYEFESTTVPTEGLIFGPWSPVQQTGPDHTGEDPEI
jgi:hypothetical protein